MTLSKFKFDTQEYETIVHSKTPTNYLDKEVPERLRNQETKIHSEDLESEKYKHERIQRINTQEHKTIQHSDNQMGKIEGKGNIHFNCKEKITFSDSEFDTQENEIMSLTNNTSLQL